MTQFIEQLFHNLFGNNVWLATILIAMVPVIELKGAIPFSMSSQIWGAESLGLLNAFFAGLIGSSIVVPILVLLYKPIINFLKKTKLFRRLGQKIEERVNSKKQKVEQEIAEQNLDKNEQNLSENLSENDDKIVIKIDENSIENDQKLAKNDEKTSEKVAKNDQILTKNEAIFDKNYIKNNQNMDKNQLKNDIKSDDCLNNLSKENGKNLTKSEENFESKNDKKTNSLKKRIASVFVFVALPFPFTGVWTGACLAVALGLNFWQATTTVILGNVVAGLIITLVSSFFGDATLIFFYAFLACILAGILFFIARAIVRKIKTKKTAKP